jgi:hypothetical protein
MGERRSPSGTQLSLRGLPTPSTMRPHGNRAKGLAALGLLAAVLLVGALPAVGSAGPTVSDSSTLAVAITGGPLSGPLPLMVSLQADASGGIGPYSYTWSFDDGSSNVAGPSVSHQFNRSGTYIVTVSVQDSFGEPGNASVQVEVLPMGLTVLLTASPSSVAAFAPTYLEANASGGVPPYSYQWSGLPPGCTGGDLASIRCVATETGGFTVRVNVTDSAGGTASEEIGLVVTQGTCPNPCSVSEGSAGEVPLWELVGFLIAAAVAGLLIGVVVRPRLRRRR